MIKCYQNGNSFRSAAAAPSTRHERRHLHGKKVIDFFFFFIERTDDDIDIKIAELQRQSKEFRMPSSVEIKRAVLEAASSYPENESTVT